MYMKEGTMEDRRHSQRTELSAELLMQRLDGGNRETTTIHVNDLSKTGIGFTCRKNLEQGAVYECNLTIWTKEVIHAFVQIVRVDEREDEIHYGGIFIGMLDYDAYRIEVYQTVEAFKRREQQVVVV